jgi:hypothetical protein
VGVRSRDSKHSCQFLMPSLLPSVCVVCYLFLLFRPTSCPPSQSQATGIKVLSKGSPLQLPLKGWEHPGLEEVPSTALN